MSENPFQAPAAEAQENSTGPMRQGEPSSLQADLRMIARRQRFLVRSIWLRLLLSIPIVHSDREAAAPYLALAVAVALVAAYPTYKLAREFHSPFMTTALMIATFLPNLIGFAALYLVHRKTVLLLDRHGIHVGFFGADPSQISD